MRALGWIIAVGGILVLIGIVAFPMLVIWAITYRPPVKVIDTFNVETTVSMKVDGKLIANTRVSHCVRTAVQGTIDNGGGTGIGSREDPFENQFVVLDDGSMIVINGLGPCAGWRSGPPEPGVVYSLIPYIYARTGDAGPPMAANERGTIAKASWFDSATSPRRVRVTHLASLVESSDQRVQDLMITLRLTAAKATPTVLPSIPYVTRVAALDRDSAALERHGIAIRASISSPSEESVCSRPVGGQPEWRQVEKADLACVGRRTQRGVDIGTGPNLDEVAVSSEPRNWALAVAFPEAALAEQHVGTSKKFGPVSALVWSEHLRIDGQRFELPVNDALNQSFAFYRPSTDEVLYLHLDSVGIETDLLRGIAQDYP